jgi:hypothetical protein
MNSAAKSASLSNVIRLLFFGLGSLYVFSRFIPSHPIADYTANVPVDNAWGQVMHVAFAQHMQFGRNIVFTYGPWGFLARGYYPPTYLTSVAAWVALFMVFTCAGWRLARHFTGNQVVIWVWLIGYAAMASIPLGNDIGERITAWGILLLFLHFFVEDEALSPLQAVLTFTLAWLGLVKFTGFVEGGFLVAVIALDNIVRQRRFPWIIPVWLAGILFFWWLAGQHLDLLWPFFKNSWEVATGYNDAMNAGELFVLPPLIYVLLGIGFCVLGAWLVRGWRRVAGGLFLAGMSGILFLSFKQGFIRNDEPHESAAVLTLLLIGLAFMAVGAARKRSLLYVAAGLFGASGLFAALTIGHKDHSQTFCRQLVHTFSFYNLFCPVVSLTTHRLQDDYEKRLTQMQDQVPLPPLPGTADLYSYFQDELFANGLGYQPRPTVQSYTAYTPALAKMNAEWLRTNRAAQSLFFALQNVDYRYPALDDGLSWPELLTRYDIKGSSDPAGTYIWLSRSPKPRQYHLQPLLETNVTMEQSFALPTNGLIWAEIVTKKTFAGDLLSFLYRSTVLTADLKFASPVRLTYRIVPGIAKAGFLLSPYISDNESFVALATADQAVLSNMEVVSMKFYESGASGSGLACYQPQIKIRFYRLDFPAQDIKLQIIKDARY